MEYSDLCEARERPTSEDATYLSLEAGLANLIDKKLADLQKSLQTPESGTKRRKAHQISSKSLAGTKGIDAWRKEGC